MELFLIQAKEPLSGAAVTYSFNPSGKGRFGDNLLAFSHGLWFSYSLGLPLVYKPFPYSDQLMLHFYPDFIQKQDSLHTNIQSLHTVQDYLIFFSLISNQEVCQGTLFDIAFYPESAYLYNDPSARALHTCVDWKDPGFKDFIHSLISPVQPMPKCELPDDRTSVALHFRTGVGFDKPLWKQKFPLKGPPDEFYYEALAYLYEALAKPLYVYIFTDDPNPPELKKKISEVFKNKDIVFACNEGINKQDLNVLEDFFALEEFDCLIRPESNYSIMASFIFSYEMVISPVHYRKESEGKIIVDQFLCEYAPNDSSIKPFITTFRK